MPRNLRIKTPLGPDALLFESMSGHEALGAPFEYRVRVSSDDGDLDLASLLGQKVTVEVDLPKKQGTRYFNGYVTSFSHVEQVGKRGLFELVVRPWLWLLSLASNCRIFQNETAVDIVKAVWREHGFSDFKEKLSGSYRTWEYSVQYRETDLNYTSRLLEQEGIYFYFEHEDGKHTVVLADSPSAHKQAKGYEEVPFFPPSEDALRERDHLSSWSVAHQMRTGKFTTTDFDFTKPKADLTSVLSKPASHSLSSFEIYDYPGEFVSSGEGETQAKVRLEEHQADQIVVKAGGNAMGLATGGIFDLTGYPREDQNAQHLIVAANYELETNSYRGGHHGVTEFQGSYTLVLGKHPYRAPAVTPKPKVDGPQTAIVVGKKGEEIWTDKYGRIKVQFHWDRKGKSDESSSCWVRVAHHAAGSRWGSIFIPRIGQEVIVDFLEGDPDRPIVTGRVYNADNMPPYDLPAQQTQSGFKTRSSKGAGPDNFNEIRFDDKKGSESFYVQAEKDHETLVKHAQKITVKGSLNETYHAGRETTVEKYDDTTVKGGNKNITVEKQYNLKAAKINVKSNGEGVFIELGAQVGPTTALIHIEPTGKIKVTGTMIEISGAMVKINS